MSLLGLGGGRAPAICTFGGRGGNPHSTLGSAIGSHLPTSQTTDYATGITGRSGQEVMDKGKAMGMNESQLSDLFNRIKL